MENNDIKLDIISISSLLEGKSSIKPPSYEIIEEYWINEDKRELCLNIKFENDHIIYKNVQKQCTVYHKDDVVCKFMNKKYSSHFNSVCMSCKEIGIDVIYGYIITNNNLIIFEQKIKGYPLISITSNLDNNHSNTFTNNHVNVPSFKLKICKFFIFKLIYDILNQLQIFHDKGYCHGDIHTGNIIVDIELYKNIMDENKINEHESLDEKKLEKYPCIFTLIDYDCVFISPDSNKTIGNTSEYMIKNNRVYHSDKIGDIQRLCSIINLLITKYIVDCPYNYEFLHKTFRFCKKIKKVDSSLSFLAMNPLKYFKDNIYVEKSIPRMLFSHDYFKNYMLETYDFNIEFKNIKSQNCYFVNTNSRKIGCDFWQLIEMNKVLIKNNIKIKYYYYKEVFIVDIPTDYKKEYIKEICKMD